MTDTQIDIIENKLLDLAINRGGEATQQYADLYLSRLNWQRSRSAEHRRDFVDQVQNAHAWLAGAKNKKMKFRCIGSGERVLCDSGRVCCPVCSRSLNGRNPRWYYDVKAFRMKRQGTVPLHFYQTSKVAPKLNDIHSARLQVRRVKIIAALKGTRQEP